MTNRPDILAASSAPVSIYDRLSPGLYDQLHGRFLRFAGGEAQSALEGALTALLEPGTRILDAGCGSGRLARRLLGIEPELDMTLLDLSPGMLKATRDLSVRRLHGSMTAMPLAEAQFDISLAFWAIEATDDPFKAVAELARVTRPGGYIGLVFCAQRADADLIDRLMRKCIQLRGTGVFLDPEHVRTALVSQGADQVRMLACRGPAIAILARQGEQQ